MYIQVIFYYSSMSLPRLYLYKFFACVNILGWCQEEREREREREGEKSMIIVTKREIQIHENSAWKRHDYTTRSSSIRPNPPKKPRETIDQCLEDQDECFLKYSNTSSIAFEKKNTSQTEARRTLPP